MAITKKNLTKALLEGAAKDFNVVMELDPPIDTNKTKAAIEKDIVSAAKHVEADDVFQGPTVEVLTALGIELPKKEDNQQFDRKRPVS